MATGGATHHNHGGPRRDSAGKRIGSFLPWGGMSRMNNLTVPSSYQGLQPRRRRAMSLPENRFYFKDNRYDDKSSILLL